MNRKKPLVSSAVNSAALQDHILRQYSIGTCLPTRSTSFARNGKSIIKSAGNDEIAKKQ